MIPRPRCPTSKEGSPDSVVQLIRKFRFLFPKNRLAAVGRPNKKPLLLKLVCIQWDTSLFIQRRELKLGKEAYFLKTMSDEITTRGKGQNEKNIQVC